jgi:hypothetical protein
MKDRINHKSSSHLQANNWKYYIKEAIKTGLESPTPYKVIPYKNGIGIKQIIFLNSGKKCCLPFDHTNDQKDSHNKSLIK